ncbi:signal peptidase I [Aeromicrobium terrae]|uniref:Signal peptidase I n=1 Tax=Aeromicrobium terrae TaxID=2498846 RepID=A0A5C8NPA3_9ACTN|nr:signal peptidase I [Aeromicrobium terrae]TXL62947.1 signal peptidase I [Aeromicrobium terrae]
MHKKMGRSASVVRQVLAWAVLLGALGLLAVCVAIPKAGGATPYTILTGSMQPKFPPGTLVVAKPTPFDDINIGDVVTYQLNSGKSEVVTHRVIGRTKDKEGRPALITQGDANRTPDPKVVIAKQVKGTMWYSAPKLGRVSNLLNQSQRDLVLSVVVIGLFGYAAFMFVGSAVERRKHRHSHDREEAAL